MAQIINRVTFQELNDSYSDNLKGMKASYKNLQIQTFGETDSLQDRRREKPRRLPLNF